MASDAKEFVKRLIRDDVREISAYHVADANGMLKLDAMENPYVWPGDQKGWLELMAAVEANRYPDPDAKQLVAELRNAMGIAERYDILLGNGSDELIHLLIQAVATDTALVMSPEPSFVMYRILANTNRVGYRGVPLTADFELDMPAMLVAVHEHQPQLLFLACPNNPTGVLYPESQLRELIAASSGLVVIDEAYIAFTDADALDLLDDYPNVVIMRTLSKVGLAGLRMGLLIGAPEWIAEINKIRLPYNINVLTQAAATFALQNFDQLREQTDQLRRNRTDLVAELKKLPDIQLWASEANFILLRTPGGEAQKIFAGLKARGVLIKCLDGAHPLLRDCLRITVGTREENARLLKELVTLWPR